MKYKPKLGDVVAVYFWDHSHNDDDDKPHDAIVYGRVAVTNKVSITIDSWARMDPKAERSPDNTVETFTLVWTAVTKVVKLTEEANE